MFHCIYINLIYYVIDYHVRIKTFQTYLPYCCLCLSDTLYLLTLLTDWFQTYSDVIQGDRLSPTLFNIFINDLVDDVNSLNLGINID